MEVREEWAKENREYTAGDVQETAGLTYRQLNDWEAKKVLPRTRASEDEWRKYTPREIFALMVCAEIRTRFGVPLKDLRWLMSFFRRKDANHFAAAAELMGIFGVGVYLLTDLKETFVLDSEFEFRDMMDLGFFTTEKPGGFIFLPLNHIVNRLLGCLKDPIHLGLHERGREIIASAQTSVAARNEAELEIVKQLRAAGERRIIIHIKDGNIEGVDLEEKTMEGRPIDFGEEIRKALNMSDFETLTLKSHDGRFVYANRKKRILHKGRRTK